MISFKYTFIYTLAHTQAFLALLSLSTAEVKVVREEGRCFWSGQCPKDVCGPTESGRNYYLFNNSMAFNVTEESDPELYSLIEEMCPMYIGGLCGWEGVCVCVCSPEPDNKVKEETAAILSPHTHTHRSRHLHCPCLLYSSTD